MLIANAKNGNLANRSATSAQLLIGVLVLLFAADVSLIRLGLIAHVTRARAAKPSFANALAEKPCRLLGNAKLASHLGRGNALACGCHHVDGHKPLMKAKAAFC